MNSSRYEPETITCRDFSKYNVDEINNELLDANWDSVYDSQFPVVKLNNFSTILLDTLNRHTPFITNRIKIKLSKIINHSLVIKHQEKIQTDFNI